MKIAYSKGHAEIGPVHSNEEEYWYTPIFGVYNPQKANQIHMVFYSSATFYGQTLNWFRLNKQSLGVLLRFRNEKIRVTGNIEQMFHSFNIREDYRNSVRFIRF